MTTLVSPNMPFKLCVVHQRPSNLVCLSDNCTDQLICIACSTLHQNHREEIISFEKLEEIYRQDRLRQMGFDVGSLKTQLVDQVSSNSTLTHCDNLMNQIKSCEKYIRQKVDLKIEREIKGMTVLLEQKKRDLPTFIGKIFDGVDPAANLANIKSQLHEEKELIRTFDKQMKRKMNSLKVWVVRGLDEIRELNSQLNVIKGVITTRKRQLGKQLDNDFKTVERVQQKKFNAQFNTGDLKGKPDQAKFQLIKKITWENQRIEDELQRLKTRLCKNQEEMLLKNHNLVKMENEMQALNLDLAQKKQVLREIADAKQREEIKHLEDLKKEKYEFQSMLVRKGAQNYINPDSLDLRGKGITEKQLKMIIKELSGLSSLDLSENNITLQEIALIFGLQKLKSLKLNFLSLTKKFISDISDNYKNTLVELHLDSNEIRDESVPDICSIRNLQVLSLIDNLVTDNGAYQIAYKLKQLTKLYLSYNKMSYRAAEYISTNLPQLKQLKLARNSIRNKGIQYISNSCKELTELHVGGCDLNKQGAILIAKGCLKLQRLSIGNNVLSTDSIIQLIIYLTELNFLEITYCDLSDDDLDVVKKVSKMNEKLVLVSHH